MLSEAVEQRHITERPKRLVPVWLRVPGHADLAEVADEHLVEELKRRGYAAMPIGRDLELPGLTVCGDGVHCVWRGERLWLGAKEHALVAALAAAYPRGLTSQQIALRIWGAAYRVTNARSVVCQVRRRYPGLLRGVVHRGSPQTYRLDLDGVA